MIDVSIVIPAYNAEKYIKETINSVISQTFQNWELIIVDDGSKDNTKALVTSFLKDNRINYVYQENGGVSAARNHGFRLSKGKYVSFLDADDLWHEKFLSTGISFLNKNPEIGLVNFNVQAIDEASTLLDIHYTGHDGSTVISDICNFKDRVTFPSNIICKRIVIEEVGGFNLELSNVADKYFYLKVAAIAKIKRIDQILLYYRLSSTNMHSNVDLMISDYQRLLKILKKEELINPEGLKQMGAKIYQMCSLECMKHFRLLNAIKFLSISASMSPKIWLDYLIKKF